MATNVWVYHLGVAILRCCFFHVDASHWFDFRKTKRRSQPWSFFWARRRRAVGDSSPTTGRTTSSTRTARGKSRAIGGRLHASCTCGSRATAFSGFRLCCLFCGLLCSCRCKVRLSLRWTLKHMTWNPENGSTPNGKYFSKMPIRGGTPCEFAGAHPNSEKQQSTDWLKHLWR